EIFGSNLRLAAREARGNPILPYEAARCAAELVGEKSESLILVPGVGLEPTWDCSRNILSVVRMPFRHPGKINLF
ncbi:MAG: hypothetical protein UU96_C0022G0001, partial [Parcubacteria group bacterium GW2011_GWC2_42_13]